MKITEIISEVISIAKNINYEREVLKQEYGLELGIGTGEGQSGNYAEAVEKLNEKLISYLSSLPLADIGRLRTIMYFGRDNEDKIQSLHATMLSEESNKETMIQVISDKQLALPTYFEAAMEKAATKNIDLDNILNS